MKKILLLGILSISCITPVYAGDALKIVTTTSTLASLVKEVTGDSVQIHAVASPKRDLHFISPTPKDVLKVKKADVFVHLGLDAEPWRDPLLVAAGNKKVMPSAAGSIDVSGGIKLLDVPSSLSRVQGDIHIYGNTHYWLSPENAVAIVHNIAQGFSRIDPAGQSRYQERAAQFETRIKEAAVKWRSRLAPYRGSTLVTYHQSWPYFADYFGFKIIGQLEPKPGIPPTFKHLNNLIKVMQEHETHVLLLEPYQDKAAARKVAEAVGGRIVTVIQSTGALEHTDTYEAMMEHNIAVIESALGEFKR